MKRLSFIGGFLLTSVLFVNLYAQQEATLGICESWGEPGSTDNSVDIEMNNPMGVAGIQFVLKFDSSLLTAESIAATPRASHMNIGCNIWSDSLKVLIYSISGDSISSGENAIIQVLFDVDSSALVGDSTLLHLKDCVLSDPNAQSIPCISQDGWFYFVVTPASPGLVFPVDGSFLSDSIPTFIWSAVGGASRYWLQIDDDSSFLSPIINDSTLTDSLYAPAAGLPDTNYCWHVRAGNRFEWSSWSLVWDFEMDTNIPNIPYLLSPEDSSYLPTTVVAFEWSEILKGTVSSKQYGVERNMGQGLSSASDRDNRGSKASPIHYILQVDTTSDFNTPIVDTTNITYDTLTLNEYLYYWRVKAYDEAGNEGNFSQVFCFVVDTTSPVVDSTTQLQDTVAFWGPFTVDTKISDNFNIKDAMLFFKINNSEWIQDTMASIGDYWYMGEIPEQTTADTLTIDYYITASDYANNASQDPEEGNYSFKIFRTGIQETRDIPDRFVLFSPKPNPSIGMVEIQYGLPEKTNVSLQLYDIQGRLVRSIYKGTKDAGYYKLHINSKDLSSGIYFIRFETPKCNQIEKLIILQ